MQDARIRLISTVILSGAAWISLTGAALALAWWIVFGRCESSIRTLRSFLLILMIPVVMGVASTLSGENGLSYVIRIGVILVIASWMYATRRPGELLDVGVWIGGTKTGFELGLIGELSMSALEVMSGEIDRVMIAIRQKGEAIHPKMIPAVVSAILIRQLRDAQERAAILALRGYTRGGTHCPSFPAPAADRIAGAFSCVIFLVSLCVRDFFMIPGSTFIV